MPSRDIVNTIAKLAPPPATPLPLAMVTVIHEFYVLKRYLIDYAGPIPKGLERQIVLAIKFLGLVAKYYPVTTMNKRWLPDSQLEPFLSTCLLFGGFRTAAATRRRLSVLCVSLLVLATGIRIQRILTDNKSVILERHPGNQALRYLKWGWVSFTFWGFEIGKDGKRELLLTATARAPPAKGATLDDSLFKSINQHTLAHEQLDRDAALLLFALALVSDVLPPFARHLADPTKAEELLVSSAAAQNARGQPYVKIVPTKDHHDEPVFSAEPAAGGARRKAGN
ncbi:unnamed protein product [Parajaminaea phylloscopi]